MDDETRDEINITEIFPSQTEDSDIIYIKCKTTEDISEITSRVRNLGQNTGPFAPSIVNHIPKIMYKRYRHCEKMLWKLRQSKTGTYQTKIRSGARDFILKYKIKGDDTPWSQVPSLTIPEEAPGAEVHLMKEKTNQPTTTTNKLPPGPPTNWNTGTQEAANKIANSTQMDEGPA